MKNDSHGFSFVYYNRAMDLNSLSINVNEDLVHINEESRSELIELQKKIIDELNNDITQYGAINFSRMLMQIYPEEEIAKTPNIPPLGNILLFPQDIGDDKMSFMLFTENNDPLDFRRMFPTFEKIQARLDEIRKVTLVQIGRAHV